MKIIGQGMDRTDGRLKVTGAAKYSAEHAVPRLAQAVMVQSTIPNGRIVAIDDAAARVLPGVLAVMTHLNAPRLPVQPKRAPGAQGNPRLTLLQDDLVQYNVQPIAVVVADTLEHAQDAARRLQVRYAARPAELSFKHAKASPRKPATQPGQSPDSSRGNAAGSMSRSAMKIDVVYTTPLESHNPMEPHATIAAWNGDELTLYDSTQNISGVRRTAVKTLGVAADKVRVVCLFVGGGFGSKGATWSHVMLAAMASRLPGQAGARTHPDGWPGRRAADDGTAHADGRGARRQARCRDPRHRVEHLFHR
jgi:xanthine dehydrogenase YagR molybdenum-binding subunit